jgi:LysR family hydrogen peroxide-inducible transcriptional activator
MVASNLGISVLPRSACSVKHENKLVKIIPFERPAPFRRVALAFRKSSAKKEAVSVVAKTIKEINTKSFEVEY